MADEIEAHLRAEGAIVDKTLVKPIELDDAHGRWVFEPKADITALEAMLISHLFTAIVVRFLKGDMSRLDWREYLTRPRTGRSVALLETGSVHETVDLKRHFIEG